MKASASLQHQPCAEYIGSRLKWGASANEPRLTLRLSSVTINLRCGWSWRHLTTKRLTALRSQAFLVVPSCFTMASGIKRITARTSGWTIVAPNPYEVPGCQETDSPSERLVPFFPRGFTLSAIRLWPRVLASLPSAGAPTWLHQTLLEGLPPSSERWQRAVAWSSAPEKPLCTLLPSSAKEGRHIAVPQGGPGAGAGPPPVPRRNTRCMDRSGGRRPITRAGSGESASVLRSVRRRRRWHLAEHGGAADPMGTT